MTLVQKLLRDLVALPSVNPAYVDGGDAAHAERDVAEFLASTAAESGMDIHFQPVLPGRSNLLATLVPPAQTRYRVVLAPHLDTVNGTEQQFRPVVRGDRLYGRGACDTKGSVAAMLQALCDLARGSKRPQHTEVTFAGLVDEEHGQTGSRHLARSGFKADLAIVGEATRLRVVTAHKGDIWLRIETRGRSAHGAHPELGVNAVHSMARVIEVIETKYQARLRRRSHRVLGRPTVNVGAVQGGSQPNIVPDMCYCRVDRRTLPGEKPAVVLREIRTLLAGAGLRVRMTEDKLAPCLPMETDITLPLVAAFLGSVGQSSPAGVDYFCDASVLSQAGIPSVVFGPGDIAQAHTANEWISLKSVERARSMLLDFLRGLP